MTGKNVGLRNKMSKIKTVANGLIFFMVPIILFYLMEAFEHNAFLEVRQLAQVYNIILFELIAWILFFVTGSGRFALRVEVLVAFLYGLTNHYIMTFRSTPFVPWDVFSIKTAASVAGNYDFTPSKEMLFVVGGFILVFVLLQFLNFRLPKKIWIHVIPAVAMTVVLCSFVNLLWDDEFQTDSYLYPFLFTPAHMTKVNGMAVTFAMDMEYLRVEKPDGYSVKRAKEILKEYEKDTEVVLEEQPNIIVIMNEAFSDLSVLGDFTTNEDYMPFVHMLQEGYENTITGMLEVSVCGGNTANTEFEFLTGHTMDFFPVGSIPYQQYVSGELPSVASQLKELGYQTYGMHPYNASGWERETVYPLLGLDTNYFVKDFEGRRYLRTYVSDQSAYEKIISVYEENKVGEPLFIFEVTMQNHGSYTDKHDNFTPDIFVEEVEDFALSQYLSLIKVSDEELEKLIAYFSQEEEKTLIVFFGDHQPNDAIANKILRLNGTYSNNLTVEAAKLRYQVPYVIWANYDIEEATGADMDISVLGAEMIEIAELPLTAYQNLLLEVKEDPDSEELLEKYQILQYYFMFDYQKE